MAVSTIDPNGLNIGQYGNRNLIINGAMQVAQRGTSATYSSNTSRGFVCDRWYAEGYPLNMTVTQSTISYDGINYNSSSLSSITGSWNFLQAVEDGYVFNVGKTLTLSFVASGSGTIQPVSWIGTVGQQNFGSSISLTGTPTRYEVTHTITGSGTGDDLYIGFNGSGGSMNVSLVQLEVGDTATPFEHRSYGQELALCERYLRRLNVGGSAFIGAMNYGSFLAGIKFPEMRAAPTLLSTGMTGYGSGNTEYRVYILNSGGGGFLSAPTTPTLLFNYATNNSGRVEAFVDPSWYNSAIDTAGAALDIGSGIKFLLEAEL